MRHAVMAQVDAPVRDARGAVGPPIRRPWRSRRHEGRLAPPPPRPAQKSNRAETATRTG